MSPERYRKAVAVLERRQPDLTVVMDGVHKPHNLAAIARSCDAVGIMTVHAVSAEGGVRLTQKAAGGSGRWVKVHSWRSLPAVCDRLRGRGFRLLAAHPGEASLDFRAVDYTAATALVVGAELEGLGEEALALADATVSVPTMGMVQSLNVSVATAVILFEAQRQRLAAGRYERPCLDEETFRCLLFEACYPRLAGFCRGRGLPYPRLDEAGRIVEAGPSSLVPGER